MEPPDSFLVKVRALKISSDEIKTFLKKGRVWYTLFAYSITVLLVLWNPSFRIPKLDKGSISTYTLRAPYDLTVTDLYETERKRKLARDNVAPVFSWDRHVAESIVQRIHAVFEFGRKLQEQKLKEFLEKLKKEEENNKTRQRKKRLPPEKPQQNIPPYPEDLDPKTIPHEFPPQAFRWLWQKGFPEDIERKITHEIERLYSAKIAVDVGELEVSTRKTIQLYDQKTGEYIPQNKRNIVVVPLLKAKADIRDNLTLIIPHKKVARQVGQWLENYIVPNFRYQSELTQKKQEEAAQGIPEVRIHVPQSSIIVRAGERIDRETALILEEYRSRQTFWLQFRRSASVLILTCLVFIGLYVSMTRLRVAHVLHERKPLYEVSLVLWVLSLLLIKFIIRFFEPTLHTFGTSRVWDIFLIYSLPYAIGPVTWALLGDRYRGWFFAVLLSPICALMLNLTLWDFLYVIGGMVIGVFLTTGYHHRLALLVTGIRLALGQMFWMALIVLSQLNLPYHLKEIAILESAGFLSGMSATFVVILIIPLIEQYFGILTDIKLLELSNVQHPLLQELIMRAPGTYFHSIGVGQLAEAAAKAIGAHALFVRVAALYHDIGKLERPSYFIENQQGKNPHDDINPNLSRIIIFSHVKAGVELAKKYKLPQAIIDMIPQHHGTKLLSFFYGKAKAIQNENGLPEENQYRYPGPPPQSKEAAILMLADGVEAAARSLKEPNPKKLANVVKTIFKHCLEDGQLDDSKLTLHDLKLMREAMTDVLIRMLHQRVSYPGFDFGEGEEKFQKLKEKKNGEPQTGEETHGFQKKRSDSKPQSQLSS